MSLGDRHETRQGPPVDRPVRAWVRFLALTIYYLAILVGLVALYGRGDFSTPPFIYQNF